MSDLQFKAISTFTTLILNGGIFAGMAWAGFAGQEIKQPEEPPFDWIDVAPVVRKGVVKDKKALPRIKAAPAPPPPETDVASLSREKEEMEEKKRAEEKKKRELAEKERRDEERRRRDEARRKKKEEEEAKRRRRAAEQAMRDVRADQEDEDAPEGRPDGSEFGTSTDPNAARNQAIYVSLVSRVLSRQFEVPSNIPPSELKRLKAKVHFRIDKSGKLKGTPRLTKSSGNRFFDKAAVRAVQKFSAGSQLKIPLPEKKGLKRFVLEKGITATMQKG